MSDLDDGPVEPLNPFGGPPERPFHVQQFEQGLSSSEDRAYSLQQNAYARKQGGYSPTQGSGSPQQDSSLRQQDSSLRQQEAYRPHHATSHTPQQGYSSSRSLQHGAGQPDALPLAKSPVVALVCGLLAWVTFGLTGPVAIVAGVKGRRAAREGRTPNGGMATAGLWLGIVSVTAALLTIPLIFAVLIPVALNQRQKGIDAVLVSDMKKMSTLQYAYIDANRGKMGFEVAATSPGGSATTPGVAFTSSPGNVIAVKVGPRGFCLSGYNAASSKANSPDASKVYLSGAAGIEPGVSSC